MVFRSRESLLDKLIPYVSIGAVGGAVIGSLYGCYDGVMNSDNGFMEAMHNITSDDPNIFSSEYWIAAKDAGIGTIAGIVVGGLVGIVYEVKEKLRKKF